MPGLVKIGKTAKDPQERVKELSSATGVAAPFFLIYQRIFNNCHEAEKKLHKFLEEKGFRINTSREFFEMTTTDAINIVQTISDEKEDCEEQFYNENNEIKKIENIGMIYLEKGNDYKYGENGCSKNFDKALENYQKALEFGNTEVIWYIYKMFYRYNTSSYCGDKFYLNNFDKAIESLQKAFESGITEAADSISGMYFEKGNDYNYGENGFFNDSDKALENYQKAAKYGMKRAYINIGNTYYNKKNIKNAINAYQKGAENGVNLCYGKLGLIYTFEENYKNATNADIAWNNFLPEYIKGREEEVLIIGSYLFFSLLYKLPIDKIFLPIIDNSKKELIECIKKHNPNGTYNNVLNYLTK